MTSKPWLVTLAEKGKEPYWSGAMQLQRLAKHLGFAFLCLGELGGEIPWQAQRLAVRRAFERGAGQVWFCDADVMVRDPGAFASLFRHANFKVYEPTIATPPPVSALGCFAEQAKHNDLVTMARVRAFYEEERSLLRGQGNKNYVPVTFWDYLVAYVGFTPEVGLSFCQVWDGLAEEMRGRDITWTNGISIGLAAAWTDIPIRHSLPASDVTAAIFHLNHSRCDGWYSKHKGCKP